MKVKRSIQFKAAFLMIVFSLNTIIGFSCAIGMDMGFNSKYHQDEMKIASMQMHANAKNRCHNEKATSTHSEAINNHHSSKDGKHNCCNDGVLKFSQLDKSVPGTSNDINPVFLITFISSFYNNGILFQSLETPAIKYFVRSYHPPIPDIRIAIQSFQI